MTSPYSDNPDAAYQRAYRAENAEKIRRRNLMRMYGITPEEFDAMRAAQDYRCAVCERTEDEIPANTSGRKPKDGRPVAVAPKLALDHCHAEHGNRKLICQRCNILIGFGGDNPALFRAAAQYLEDHGCAH